MSIFRRPELEKDNPIAPQPYIGPRRRLALARAAAASGVAGETGDIQDTLHTLTEAASRYVTVVPKGQKADARYKALCDAIQQAKRFLSADERVAASRRKKS